MLWPQSCVQNYACKALVFVATEKLDKYRDLQIAIQHLWNVTVIVVPIIIGALGCIPHDLLLWLRKLDFDDRMIPLLQKTVLLETAALLHWTLNIHL